MNFNKVIQLFLPKDKAFHPLFKEVASNLENMSRLLLQGVEETNAAKRQNIFEEITDFEHKNDHTTHQILTALATHFITPFDREDIQALAMNLDDVADYINATTKKMALYEFHQPNKDISDLAKIIEESVFQLKAALEYLDGMNHLAEIKAACIQVNNLENKADDIFERAVAILFKMESDTKQIMILKDLLECLETATDKCEDVANVIESIIIKYS